MEIDFGKVRVELSSAKWLPNVRVLFDQLQSEIPRRLEIYRQAFKIVCQAMEEDSRRMFEILRQTSEILFRQFPFLHDVLVVANFKQSPPDENAQYAACERLAKNHFSQGKLFVPARWAYLKDAFARRKEDGNFEATWVQIAVPAIYIAIKEMPADLSLGDMYSYLRRKIRRAIEKDLFDGLTVDEYIYHQDANAPLPDEDTLEAREIDKRLATDFASLSNLRIDVFSALQSLDEEQIAVLLAENDREIAAQQKIKPATLRKKRERIKKRLQKKLA